MAFRRFTAQGTLDNDTPVDLLTPRTATTTIYVTKATLSITTHGNGKAVEIKDDNSSAKIIAKHNDLTAAAGVPSVVTWDFGRGGIPLTQGKKLRIVSESSGVAGHVYVEGFQLG